MDQERLDRIQVAAPCTAAWVKMKGDDQVRFCGECRQNVYNLSAMTLDEITHLVEGKEGRTCVTFYRRADGRVLTENCSVGVRAVRRRLAMIGTAVASVMTLVGLGAFASREFLAGLVRRTRVGRIRVVREAVDWLVPERIMGEMRELPCPSQSRSIQKGG